MAKGVVVGVLVLVVGFFFVSEVILPAASVLLARPDINTWTGLGAFLHILGGLLVAFLLVVAVKAVYEQTKSQ